MVGAFLAGAVLDASMFNQAQMDQFRGHVLLAIMPVFFLSTGLRTTWELGGLVVFGAAALLLVASVSGKLIGSPAGGQDFAMGKRRGVDHRVAAANEGADHDHFRERAPG